MARGRKRARANKKAARRPNAARRKPRARKKKPTGKRRPAGLARIEATAVATKKIAFKFTGTWDEQRAAVDDTDELESPNASRNLAAGQHSLSWAITGAPGAGYTVSITGCDPKDWTRDFQIEDDGRGIGSHPFQVKVQ